MNEQAITFYVNLEDNNIGTKFVLAACMSLPVFQNIIS